MPESNLHKLSALGQSVWIDYLSRDLLETGELERKLADALGDDYRDRAEERVVSVLVAA